MSVKFILGILFMRYFVFDQFNSCLQDKEEQLDEGEKSITVDECLIDIIKGKIGIKTFATVFDKIL